MQIDMTKDKYEEILSYLRDVTAGTEWEGKVYTVGGCLRDSLMGQDIHDVDLAVNTPDGGVVFPLWLEKRGLTLEPPTLYRRFSSSRLRLKAFPEEEIEVVQTRREQYTDANSRNPEVCFGSVLDDCLRRDLTINSLYQNISTGEVLDLTGRGVEDIRHHRIQTPMEPQETYSDDPIRILRTLRFAVRYGWEIPEDLWQAMRDNAGRMRIVRRPRVRTEFEKMMESNDPVKLLRKMKQIGVIFKVMPELCHLYRIKDHTRREELGPNAPLPTLWDITMEKLAETVGSDRDSLEARYAALFTCFDRIKIPYSESKEEKEGKRRSRGVGRNAIITIALRRLMYDYDFIRRVKKLLSPGEKIEEEPPEIKKGKKRKNKNKLKESVSSASEKKRKRRRRRRRRKKESTENGGE